MQLRGALAVLLFCLLAVTIAEGHRWRRPIYSRRLSKEKMGRKYYGYASRYPGHHCHRRRERERLGDDDDDDEDDKKKGQVCSNYLALPNGSYVGKFTCPFLEDEKKSWTKCCGYEGEQFCCHPSYDDSWAHKTHFWLWTGICGVVLLLSAAAAAVGLFLCYRARAKARVADSTVNVKSGAPESCADPLPEKRRPEADGSFGLQNPVFTTAAQPMPPAYTATLEADGMPAAAPQSLQQPPPAYNVDTQ